MRKHVPVLGLLVAFLAVLLTLLPSRPASEFDLAGFGRLPALVNGRIKPLDTVARTSLLVLHGRQRLTLADGRIAPPVEWLLDVLYRPEMADTFPTFEIVHPDVLTLFTLAPEDGTARKFFTLTQLAKGIPELDRQAKLAEGVESALRTSFQRAVIQLRNAVLLYQRLQSSVNATGSADFLAQLDRFEELAPAGLAAVNSKRAGQPHDAAAAKAIRELSASFATMEAFGYLLPIPPAEHPADVSAWKSAGASLRESLGTGRLDPSMRAYVEAGLAWRNGRAADFNRVVHGFHAQLAGTIPSLLTRCNVEAFFNAAEPFYTSMLLYLAAFLLAVLSWLKWPDELRGVASRIVLLAWIVATAGIATRMWLEGRPPVTNLYSSALFVGWAAVAACLLLEAIHRNAIGSAAAGVIGFVTLLIAHHLALGGDTLEMMRAVLDSNIWLATHVVAVTIGYAATFLAGFLALIYVLRGVATRSLDPASAAALTRMTYGTVCFATLFSFIGTVLGGIWADQSWGRFWGWDPKENGALIIVLWNALILHARWGGLVKARGLMVLAIFGNVVTSWSWFGVNMLGVGLHSYGFMDAALWWLLAFVASQVAMMIVAAIPLDRWRSFRAA
jgi:ABC-type transport system involved in cytochrome c biogenesis permease subunit